MPSDPAVPFVNFKKILYATDLSESGRFAFPFAAGIAYNHNAALTVFHVIETDHFEKYLDGYINEEMWEKIKTRDLEEARNLLVNRKRKNAVIKENIDNICQEILTANSDAPCVAYDITVRKGDPAVKIVKEVQEQGYDLVIMCNHGRRSLTASLMGGTARRVLHRCHVPVIIVPLPKS